jgi:hypothetical protein
MKLSGRFIKFTVASALVFATLVLAAATGKPITVKGYVLDSACAFTKGLETTHQPGLCPCLCESWFSVGDLGRGRDDLLAHRRHHALERTK